MMLETWIVRTWGVKERDSFFISVTILFTLMFLSPQELNEFLTQK